jgi:hypothetical protein
MLAGVDKSIDKVYSFASLIPASDRSIFLFNDVNGDPVTVADRYLSTASLEDNKTKYLTDLGVIYDNAVGGAYATSGYGINTDALDVIIKEYLIALWGNGYEAYNNLRRTGRPLNHQPMLDTAPGSFVYSCFYPSNHVNFNPNAVQKAGLEEKVFWDTNGDIVR